MTVRGPLFVTPHAVRRFRERVRPELTYEQARDELVRLSRTAHRVRPTRDGAELWRTGPPERLRLIVGPGTGPLPALITVEARCDRDQRD